MEAKIEIIQNDDGTQSLKFDIPKEMKIELKKIIDRNQVLLPLEERTQEALSKEGFVEDSGGEDE